MDELISKLRARRDRLAAELNRVEDALVKAERAYAEIVAFVADLELDGLNSAHTDVSTPSANAIVGGDTTDVSPDTAKAVEHEINPPRRTRGPKGSSPEEIAEAADLIIKDHGKPMTRFELIEPIEAMGLTIGGFDKPRNLGTILWRSGRFISTGEGYWPAEPPEAEPAKEPSLEDMIQ